MIFPGSVGLSNPIKSDRTQQQQQKRSSENEVKHVSSKDQPVKRAAGPQGALLEDVVIPPAVDPTPAPKVEQEISTSTEIVRDASTSELISVFPSHVSPFPTGMLFFFSSNTRVNLSHSFFFGMILDTSCEYRSSSDESLVDNSTNQSIM